MIMLFDNPTDWMNLSAVYASVDDEERRVRSLNLAYLRGYLDDDARFLNLGQSMAGIDIPYTGSKIIEDGIAQDYVELDEDNLTTLTQMYLLASDWEGALAPAQQLSEVSESGDGFDTLGYIHYVMTNYQEAADAFQAALDKGDLSDHADTLIFLSRSLIELDDFEGATAAAREASDAGDSNDRENAASYLTFIDSTKTRFDLLAERREDAIDFYESYPPLD
jgi:tetratricopeptide (TPR) repeat protein